MKPYIHAKASVAKNKGSIEDYIFIHDVMDWSKESFASVQHRLFSHHSYGCYLIEELFGKYKENSSGKHFSPRDIAEQHCTDDMMRIIPVNTWAKLITVDEEHPVIPTEDMTAHTRAVLGGDVDLHRKINLLIDGVEFACQSGVEFRGIMHHATSLKVAQEFFGPLAVRILTEHMRHELGFVPTLGHWCKFPPQSWMGPTKQQAEKMSEYSSI